MWMLAAELEACEATRLQSAPQFLLLVRLVATEAAGDGGGVHGNGLFVSDTGRQQRTSSPRPSPPFRMEEREMTRFGRHHATG